MICSAYKLGQCFMLFMNKFTISFIKSDVNESGTNKKAYINTLIYYLDNENP